MKTKEAFITALIVSIAFLCFFLLHYVMIQNGDYYYETCKYEVCLNNSLYFEGEYYRSYYINNSVNSEKNNNWQCICENMSFEKEVFYIDNNEYIISGWYKLMFKIAGIIFVLSFIIFMFINPNDKRDEDYVNKLQGENK